MRLWRISAFADLSGQGGLLAPARWHSKSVPIVYLTDHPAAALLEVLVHLEVEPEDMPDAYQLLAVDVPDDVAFRTVDDLAPDWRADTIATQTRGEEWLASGTTALLRVPSAIVPEAWNWLLNPRHADAGLLQITKTTRATFDPRLFG